jgi:hypothetical protein
MGRFGSPLFCCFSLQFFQLNWELFECEARAVPTIEKPVYDREVLICRTGKDGIA